MVGRELGRFGPFRAIVKMVTSSNPEASENAIFSFSAGSITEPDATCVVDSVEATSLTATQESLTFSLPALGTITETPTIVLA